MTQIAQQFALGARPGDLDAVAWLERAGSEVLAVSPSIALTLFEQALDLAPTTWPGRAALQARMIEPLAGCGRFDEGEAVARIVLESSPDADVEFAALRGLTAVLGNRGDIAASIEALHTAANATGAPPGESRLLRGLAGQLSSLMGSDADEARIAAQDALTDATAAGDEGLVCLSHQTLGVAAVVSGYDEDALARMTSALALLDSGRLPWNSYLIADFWVAICLAVLDRTDEAAIVAGKALLRAEQQGSTSTIPYGYLAVGFPQLLSGHFDDAVANYTAALTVMDETQNNNFVLYSHAILATIALHRGDIASATDHLSSGAQWLSSGAAPLGADVLFGAQAEFLVANGQSDAALTVAEATWVQSESIRYLLAPRARAAVLVRLAVAGDRGDLAQEVTEAMEEGARRSPALSAAATARRCRGLFERDPEALLEAVALLRNAAAACPGRLLRGRRWCPRRAGSARRGGGVARRRRHHPHRHRCDC